MSRDFHFSLDAHVLEGISLAVSERAGRAVTSCPARERPSPATPHPPLEPVRARSTPADWFYSQNWTNLVGGPPLGPRQVGGVARDGPARGRRAAPASKWRTWTWWTGRPKRSAVAPRAPQKEARAAVPCVGSGCRDLPKAGGPPGTGQWLHTARLFRPGRPPKLTGIQPRGSLGSAGPLLASKYTFLSIYPSGPDAVSTPLAAACPQLPDGQHDHPQKGPRGDQVRYWPTVP